MAHFTEKPLAAPGLKSYRYRGLFNWVMIGARDHQEALAEAKRSVGPGASYYGLEKWDASSRRYVPV